ncbi:insulinase family protein [Ferrimonas gelatinilytica]|uniref:Peptidase M16 C-terminal domain-containing protein n=1 Tax=Ferrimonas gelatinilytica TaxID=1255257 RepID=A0ABP9SGR8_9GAMM
MMGTAKVAPGWGKGASAPWGQALGLLLSAMAIVILQGCHSRPISFSEPSAVTLPQFAPLPGAPEIPALALPQRLEAKVSILPSGHPWHAMALPPSGRQSLTLVALSAEPYGQIRFLAEALRLQRLALMQRVDLPCIDTLKISAQLHSVALQLSCPDSVAWGDALALLVRMVDPEEYRRLDLREAARRRAVTDRINGAVDGEMDRVWRELLLGRDHPYVRALDEAPTQDRADRRLQQALSQLHRQSRWQVITRSRVSATEELASALSAPMDALMALDAQVASSSAQASVSLAPEATARVPGGAIHLLDAPGSAQLQVYLGYRMPESGEAGKSGDEAQGTLICESLAAWLGRSFTGRLFYDLREVRGWTYGIHGYCAASPMATMLTFSGSTRLEHSGAFVSGVLDHLARAAEEAPPKAEVRAVQRYAVSRARVATASEDAALWEYLSRLVHPRPPLAPWLQAQDGGALRQAAATLFARPPVILLRGDARRIRQDLNAKLPQWPIVMVPSR